MTPEKLLKAMFKPAWTPRCHLSCVPAHLPPRLKDAPSS